jgi:hypothetical protein
VPSGLSVQAAAHIDELALAAFEMVGGAGWGSVDFRSDPTGRPHLLSVNTTPGMSGHDVLPLAAQAAGIDFDSLVWRVLESSLGRVRTKASVSRACEPLSSSPDTSCPVTPMACAAPSAGRTHAEAQGGLH